MNNENITTKLIKWNDQQALSWEKLFKLNIEKSTKGAIAAWGKGVKHLGLNSTIPNMDELRDKFKSETGLEIVNTSDNYMSSLEWFWWITKGKFVVSDFIRPLDSLGYTPFPDAFHDIFGHLPILVDPDLRELILKFANKLNSLTGEAREEFERVWWYTFEFGLIKENGQIKYLGAGFMSSKAEKENFKEGKVELCEFDFQEVKKFGAHKLGMHPIYFVVNSLEDISRSI